VAIVDSATATASALAELLGVNGLEAPGREGTHVQLTTGDVDVFRGLAGRLFGSAFPDVTGISIGAAIR
jgi:glutamate racemase